MKKLLIVFLAFILIVLFFELSENGSIWAEVLSVYLINGIIFGLLTKYVSKSKGYEDGYWWGFFFGIIGLLVVGFRPKVEKSTSLSMDEGEYEQETEDRGVIVNKTATDKTVAQQIKEFKELCDEGVITVEEYEGKKKQLLGL